MTKCAKDKIIDEDRRPTTMIKKKGSAIVLYYKRSVLWFYNYVVFFDIYLYCYILEENKIS